MAFGSPVRVLAAVVAVLLLCGGGALALTGRSTPIERAQRALADGPSYARGTDAGAALVEASRHLEQAGEECGTGERCEAMLTAAAVVRVSSVGIVRCTRPEVFQARAALAAHIDALARAESPTPPAPVSCA